MAHLVIWLNIDHIIFDHSNYFKYKTTSQNTAGSYMNIVYLKPTTKFPNGILATHNLWDELPDSGVNYHISTCDNNNISTCVPHDLMVKPLGINEDCTDYQGRIEETLAAATPQQKATVVLSTGKKDLLPKFLEGLQYYYLQDYNAAKNSLSEIANLGDDIRNASDNPYVQYYINIARTIAPRTTLPTIGNQKVANIKNTNAMFIFPNPAEGFFKLVLPSGRYDVQLSDVLGRVIKQIQVSDYEDISTEHIQSGLYQVTVRKQGEQAVFQTGKIVIKE